MAAGPLRPEILDGLEFLEGSRVEPGDVLQGRVGEDHHGGALLLLGHLAAPAAERLGGGRDPRGGALPLARGVPGDLAGAANAARHRFEKLRAALLKKPGLSPPKPLQLALPPRRARGEIEELVVAQDLERGAIDGLGQGFPQQVELAEDRQAPGVEPARSLDAPEALRIDDPGHSAEPGDPLKLDLHLFHEVLALSSTRGLFLRLTNHHAFFFSCNWSGWSCCCPRGRTSWSPRATSWPPAT